MYVEVKVLDAAIQTALKAVGYGRKDISLSARETYTNAHTSGQGRRAFTCAINLESGRFQVEKGSWGGPNMFNPGNHVDLDDAPRPLPRSCAIIQGVEGGNDPVWAHILVNPQDMAGFLPSAISVTDRQMKILKTFNHISSYRKQEQASLRVTEEELVKLHDLGLILKNKRGCSITTKGKNTIKY